MLRLRHERINRHWTQTFVAEKINTTKQAVQYLETGKIKPSYKVLVKFENLFNLSHRDLLEQVPDENILSEKKFFIKNYMLMLEQFIVLNIEIYRKYNFKKCSPSIL